LATFEEQVEGLTGLTIGSSPAPSTAELTQFLRDGALNVTDKWIIGHPEDKESFQRESSPIENNGDFDLKGADIISVMRENETDGSSDGSTAWRPCRKIPPSLQSQVVDTESLSFASKYHPVYTIIDFNEVHVYPTPDGTNDSFKVFYVNHVPKDLTNSADLAYTHSDIKYFPANKVRLVVIYASIQTILAVMSNSVITTTAVPPDVPTISSQSVSLSGTAPTYNNDIATTAIDLVTTTIAEANNFIDSSEDVELASAKLAEVQATANDAQLRMQNELNEFNQANVLYQSTVQRDIQNPWLHLQFLWLKLR